jgi:hypothetical protein
MYRFNFRGKLEIIKIHVKQTETEEDIIYMAFSPFHLPRAHVLLQANIFSEGNTIV